MLFLQASILLLASLGNTQDIVTLTPQNQLISMLGGRIVFSCTVLSHATVQSVEWLVNETLLEDVNMYNATVHALSPGIETMEIHKLTSELNRTRIGCRAVFSGGRIVNSTSVLILLQGLLAAVESLTITDVCCNLTLTWIPPFSLDITLVDPDITYCVDAVTYSNSSKILYSECNLIRVEFNYLLLPTTRSINFTITPVNLVGNGTTLSKSYLAPTSRPELVNTVFEDNVTFIMSTQVQCSVQLIFVDVDSEGEFNIKDTDLTINEGNITFISQLLTKNRHYNATIWASYSCGQAVFNTRISTHDIENATVSNDNGRVNIATGYFVQSSAAGALFSFVFMNGDSVDWTSAIYTALDRNTSRSHMLSFSLSPGRYKVFVYDIESDGTLASGVSYPAVNRELLIIHNTQGPNFMPTMSLLENCTVIFTFGCIIVECAYNSCYRVTGFQMIAQLSNSSEVHRLYVNKTTDGQTLASVVVEESGIYQVSVFPISGETGILESFVEFVELLIDLPTSTSITTMSTPVTNGGTISTSFWTGMGLGMGILAVISAVLGVIVVIQCFKIRIRRKWPKETNVQQQQEVSEEEMAYFSIPQLYEEIEDMPSRAAPSIPQYEDVIPAAVVSKSSDPYQISLCSAYGVQNCV